jgi:hypothetical protein
LLILTDGDVTDYLESCEEINNSCELPISVIVVGVGKEEFIRVKKLGDGGKRGLKDD